MHPTLCILIWSIRYVPSIRQLFIHIFTRGRQRVHGRAGHVTKSEVLLAEFSFNEIFFVFFLLRGAGVVFTIMRGAGVEPQSPLEIGD